MPGSRRLVFSGGLDDAHAMRRSYGAALAAIFQRSAARASLKGFGQICESPDGEGHVPNGSNGSRAPMEN
ncbi:hypothetical protein GCK32_022284 [Trichostrongylus colubriformis]|uniref:Uncharacterized protein n=1 Tax=Trichostrongylus colubriformis TaxID=6319 RepID=A0AAN8F8X0_TRICO